MALKGRELLLSEGMFTLKRRPGPGLCPVKGCTKKSRPHGCAGLCCRHYQARWRFFNRKQSAYSTLRDHAKARGLEFSIDFRYFAGFLDAAASWDTGAEKRGDIVTIDRKDETIGYREGNLQVLTLSENVAKNNKIRRLPAYVQSVLARKRARVQDAVETYEERLERTGEPF